MYLGSLWFLLCKKVSKMICDNYHLNRGQDMFSLLYFPALFQTVSVIFFQEFENNF